MNNKGKVVSIKQYWMVRSVLDKNSSAGDKFKTRREARDTMRLLKEPDWFESVKMYKTTEIEFADGQIILSMERAR